MREFITIQGFHCIEASVEYALGGYNWYNGANDPRGYYLYLSPGEGDGFATWSTIIGSGSKHIFLPCERRSNKHYLEALFMIRDKSPQLEGMLRAVFAEQIKGGETVSYEPKTFGQKIPCVYDLNDIPRVAKEIRAKVAAEIEKIQKQKEVKS